MEEIMSISHFKHIDLLKVDIEGAEKDLFGYRENNSWLKDIKLIIIELHGDYTVDALQNDLGMWGFKVFPPGSKYGNRMVMTISKHLQMGNE